MTTDIRIVVCIRGVHRYVWLYTDATYLEATRSIGRCAADPELEFDWIAAAMTIKNMDDQKRS